MINKLKKTYVTAIAKGDIPTIDQCLNMGVDINTLIRTLDFMGIIGEYPGASYILYNDTDRISRTNPLFLAIKCDQEEAAIHLVKKGIDIHSKNLEGETALFTAAQKNMCRLIDCLEEKGLDINETNAYGENLLYVAAVRGANLDTIQYLVEQKGLSPLIKYNNELINDNESAIIWAIDIDVIEYFFERFGPEKVNLGCIFEEINISMDQDPDYKRNLIRLLQKYRPYLSREQKKALQRFMLETALSE